MGQTIEITEKSAALLAKQAAAHGKTVQAWVEELAIEKEQDDPAKRRKKIRTAVQGILELQKQVQADPEGWTVRQYIDRGRA